MGPGFDALGLALGMYLEVKLGSGEGLADGHPALVAFTSAGGEGPIAVRSQIPMGRGLGFSGAARVAGVLAALAQQDGGCTEVAELATETLARAADLEGHEDNVAASLYGGVVAVAGGRAVQVPLGLEPAIVVWVPTTKTSTDESRGRLPSSVTLADATFNIGRTALLVAALAAGDRNALRTATADRLHQDVRLASAPESRQAMNAAIDAGAWCSWLSGSGPTVAAMADPANARECRGRLAGHRPSARARPRPSGRRDRPHLSEAKDAELCGGVASGVGFARGSQPSAASKRAISSCASSRASSCMFIRAIASRVGSVSWCCADPSVTTRAASDSRPTICSVSSVSSIRRCEEGARDAVTTSRSSTTACSSTSLAMSAIGDCSSFRRVRRGSHGRTEATTRRKRRWRRAEPEGSNSQRNGAELLPRTPTRLE